ncbi:hypothetical protein J2125_000207 [Erwinia toletana]|uniref:Uncharacterized protein n=1 Tax=Winslowiella toletana TaxID=92490 RepID=A0ABS4P2Y2_9GAMM|nr:hypothetical protein [Winslowiella toletana]MBP2167015.1 hypothetical protein [Winslowiella toletana]
MALILGATKARITNPDAVTIFIRPDSLPAFNGRMIFRDSPASISDVSASGMTGETSGTGVIWLPDGVQVNRLAGINLDKLPAATHSFYSVFRMIVSGATEFYPLHNFSAYATPGPMGEAITERTPRASSPEEYGALRYTNDAGGQGTLASTADPELARPARGDFVFRMAVFDATNYQYRLYTGKGGTLTEDIVSAATDIAKRDLSRPFQVGINSTVSFTGLTSSGGVSEVGFFDDVALVARQVAAVYESVRVDALERGISV